MSNEAKTSSDVTGAASNRGEGSSECNQPEVDLVSRVFKASLDVFEPLSKASLDLFGQALQAGTELLQKLSASIASKK